MMRRTGKREGAGKKFSVENTRHDLLTHAPIDPPHRTIVLMLWPPPSWTPAPGRGRSGCDRLLPGKTPALDILDVETPGAVDAERWNLSLSDEPIDGCRMAAQQPRYFFDCHHAHGRHRPGLLRSEAAPSEP
jgi:hypothetical protein